VTTPAVHLRIRRYPPLMPCCASARGALRSLTPAPLHLELLAADQRDKRVEVLLREVRDQVRRDDDIERNIHN
jgi:hypothetical protein